MLRVGMTAADIKKLLGPPYSRTPTGTPSDGDEVLDYSMPPTSRPVAHVQHAFGGVRLLIYLSNDRLLTASSYQRYAWGDSAESIFYLDAEGPAESARFNATYCPES
jgi:hypothetical protein